MFVCICHGVTEKDIQKAAKAGAESLQDVRNMTGATTGCGGCADVALEVLLASKPKPTPDFLQIIKPSLNMQTVA